MQEIGENLVRGERSDQFQTNSTVVGREGRLFPDKRASIFPGEMERIAFILLVVVGEMFVSVRDGNLANEVKKFENGTTW